MKFLDSNGLTHFWNKIKTFVSNNYLSLTGGTIRGSVSFLNEADGGKSIRIDPSNITNSRYGVNYLFASGKMIPIGEANGVASLDSEGNIPLRQLRNLDTTVAEVVTALPKTNIKKHIYLIKDASGVTQNQYEEYIYTGDTSATYDASKWEKLGDFRATVDLADYAKKSETVEFSRIRLDLSPLDGTPQIQQQSIRFVNFNGDIKKLVIKDAESNMAGFMSVRDKNKLDIFDTSSVRTRTIDVSKIINNISIVPDEDKIEIQINDISNNFKPSVHIESATEDDAGVMSVADKTKLNSIATGATADSAITTAEIDALITLKIN